MFGRCMDFLMKSSWTQIKEKLNIWKNDFGVNEMISVGKYIWLGIKMEAGTRTTENSVIPHVLGCDL